MVLIPSLPRTARVCAFPFCGSLAVEGAFCKPHISEEPQRDYRRFQDAVRAKQQKYRMLYNRAQWRKRTRPAIFARDPICKMPPPYQTCYGRAASTVIDHIIDHRGDWKLFFDTNNLRGVCKKCHDTKTAMQYGFGKGPQGPPVPPPLRDILVPKIDLGQDFKAMMGTTHSKEQ